MEIKGIYVLIAFVIALAVCVFVVYDTVPEYIHLEDMERANYENQLATMEANHKAVLDDWLAYAQECDDYETTIRAEEEQECSLEKKEQVQRLSNSIYDAIEINDNWQDLYEDLNKSVHDLNNTIADLNCWR